jgi:hypothetical protein
MDNGIPALIMGAVALAGGLFAAWAMHGQRRTTRLHGQYLPGEFNALTGGDWYDRSHWRAHSRDHL